MQPRQRVDHGKPFELDWNAMSLKSMEQLQKQLTMDLWCGWPWIYFPGQTWNA